LYLPTRNVGRCLLFFEKRLVRVLLFVGRCLLFFEKRLVRVLLFFEKGVVRLLLFFGRQVACGKAYGIMIS